MHNGGTRRPQALSGQVARGGSSQHAEHLAIMGLQPPPDHRGGSGLAGVHQGGPALPGAVPADAQIEVIERVAE